MKTLILTFIVTSFITCGTDQGIGKFYEYTVRNESGKTITIKSYLSSYPNVSPIITTINKGRELTRTYQDILPPGEYNFKVFFGGDRQRDSLKIIYNNSKVQFFIEECAENDRNPLNFCIYRETEEIFIFTEQDYENAEDCNGNCE